VTTPPNPPDDNENIYGGPPPSGQNPYGATPYPGAGYGAQPVEKKTDPVSIAAFVTGLICCAPVGVILGIVGIVRTKNAQRKGRWAAITGLVLGVLGIVAWIGVVAGGVWIFSNTIRPDNAEVGQCVDIETDGGEVSMLKKDCTEDHDGEIVGVEEVTDDNREEIETGMADYCRVILSEEDLATIDGNPDLELGAVIEDPDNVQNGDTMVCYVESTSGKLDEKILD
jgi:hypothetical protein